MRKAGEVLQSCERSFVSLTELEKFKISMTENPVLTNHFAFEVVKNLPT
jgi:hypothetical protein